MRVNIREFAWWEYVRCVCLYVVKCCSSRLKNCSALFVCFFCHSETTKVLKFPKIFVYVKKK